VGASVWKYWVDYDADGIRAFDALRDRVFCADEYIGPGGDRFGGEAHPLPRPASIDDLLEACGESGTHTILDIVHFAVAGNPRAMQTLTVGHESYTTLPIVEGGECRMATDEEVRALLGTDRPSRAQIDERGDFTELLGRGEALCVVAWDGDRPCALYFQGRSGD
jgi:hypothetical protein